MSTRMDRKKAIRAAGAGLVATGIFLAALLALGTAVFFVPDLVSGAGTDGWWIAALVLVFSLITIGGALPARALGAGWLRSLGASVVVAGGLALAAPSLVSSPDGLFMLFYLFAFVAPAFIAIAASAGQGLSFAGLAAVIVVAALFFLVLRTGFFVLPGIDEVNSALVQGTVMVAAGWTLLPALVGLLQRPQIQRNE